MESKASLSFLFTIFLCCVASSQAYDFLVGGRDGWVLSPSESYDSWAGRMRFQVNDTLVFRYQNGTDSVLAVNRQDYDTCNTSNPILRLEGGDSRYLLERSGPFYFITGNQTNCVAGQKLILIVMSPRNPPTIPLPTPATPPGGAPSPQVQPPSGGLAPTPGGSQAPTPTPSGGLAPTPSGSQAPTPTPTPSGGLAPTPGGGQAPTPTPTPSGGQAPTPSGGVAPTPSGGEGPSGSEGPSGGGGSGGGGGGPSGSEGPSGGGGGSDGGGGGTPGAPQSSSPALVSSMGFSVLVIMVLGSFIGTF